MKSLFYALIISVLCVVASECRAQTIVISDFNNSGFDFYPGPPSNWLAATTLGPEYLSIIDPDQGVGTTGFSTFINPIPDLTGITEFQFSVRLGSGNQVNDLAFVITTLNGGFARWDIDPADLNSTTFTTLIFELASPDELSGVLDMRQVTTINFASPNLDNSGLNLQMEFGNLVAAAVPEPSATLLLGLAGVVLLRRRMRSK